MTLTLRAKTDGSLIVVVLLLLLLLILRLLYELTNTSVVTAGSWLIGRSDGHSRRWQALCGWSTRPSVRTPAKLRPLQGRLPRLLGFHWPWRTCVDAGPQLRERRISVGHCWWRAPVCQVWMPRYPPS